MTLKRGSLNSFFSAARFTPSSTLARMKAPKSDSKVRASSAGNSAGGADGIETSGRCRLRRDQRRRKFCSSLDIGLPAVLRRKKRLRPHAFLRLGPVVLLDEGAHPVAHR